MPEAEKAAAPPATAPERTPSPASAPKSTKSAKSAKSTKSTKSTKRRSKPRRKPAAPRWEGDIELPDGGLAMVDEDNILIQLAPGKLAVSLRYFLARLQRDTDGHVPTRIAFTSALSGEGVSVMARSFAAVLAHDSDRRVCLVDLNWWSFDRRTYRPSDEVHGLYEVLWNDKPLDAVLVSTQSPQLAYLPAGSASRSVRPMLARHRDLPVVLDQLAERFDHLVFDLPAVLATSDTLALSALTDAIALVVQQGVASKDQLQAAIDDLGVDRPVGVVLNKTESAIPRPIRRLLGLS